jgi:hypothetical protein
VSAAVINMSAALSFSITDCLFLAIQSPDESHLTISIRQSDFSVLKLSELVLIVLYIVYINFGALVPSVREVVYAQS